MKECLLSRSSSQLTAVVSSAAVFVNTHIAMLTVFACVRAHVYVCVCVCDQPHFQGEAIFFQIINMRQGKLNREIIMINEVQ